MRKASVAIVFILLTSAGEYAMVFEHFLAQFDGVVVARTDDVHYPPWTRNFVTRYVIREPDGDEHVFHADPQEGHINGFPIGTRITKQRWHLDYEVDGKETNDFPLPFYAFWMMLDAALLTGAVIVGIMIDNRDRRTRELEAAVERGKRLLDEDP